MTRLRTVERKKYSGGLRVAVVVRQGGWAKKQPLRSRQASRQKTIFVHT